MSRQQTVQFVGLRMERTQVPTDAREFYPKARWGGIAGRVNVWLQRKAWAYLGQQGALKHYFRPDVSYHRYVVDPQAFAKAIYTQKRELHDHWMHTARTLLIGSEDYADLMCSPEFVQHASAAFSFQVDAYRSNQDERGKWREPTMFGLEVHVVPWMRGMVVMP